MPLRLLIASVAGWIVYMIAMMMTTYDGFPSMVLQPVAGAICTSLSLLIILIAGLPLVFSRIWKWWTKMWWLSIVILVLSIFAMFLSWLPGNRELVYNPDVSSMTESFHPVFGLGGWFGMLFAIAWTPIISIRNTIQIIQSLSGRKHLSEEQI